MIYIFNRAQYGLKNFDSGDRNFELDFSVKKAESYICYRENQPPYEENMDFFKKMVPKNRVKKGLSMFIFLHIFYKVEKWIVCNETII